MEKMDKFELKFSIETRTSEWVLLEALNAIEKIFPGLSPEKKIKIQLVLSELVNNGIDHGALIAGKTEVKLELIRDHRFLILRFTDSGGLPFDPLFFHEVATRDRECTGGRGIFMVENISHCFFYQVVPGVRTTAIVTLECE